MEIIEILNVGKLKKTENSSDRTFRKENKKEMQ